MLDCVYKCWKSVTISVVPGFSLFYKVACEYERHYGFHTLLDYLSCIYFAAVVVSFCKTRSFIYCFHIHEFLM